MSMISEQCDKLQCQADYIRRTIPELKGTAKLIEEAVDTIKTQSEKLHAYAMERSSQHYHNGWIPCSERLPMEKPSIFAKLKGTPKWDRAMWENSSDTVIVTRKYEDGSLFTDIAHTRDGVWVMDKTLTKYKIIAWRPLPAPYKKEDTE